MKKIAGYRRMLVMNQTDMANYLNISLQSYWSKENGRTPFTDKEKMAVKDLLIPYFPELTIDSLFFDDVALK